MPSPFTIRRREQAETAGDLQALGGILHSGEARGDPAQIGTPLKTDALALLVGQIQPGQATGVELPFLLVKIAIGQAEGPAPPQDRLPHLAALLGDG